MLLAAASALRRQRRNVLLLNAARRSIHTVHSLPFALDALAPHFSRAQMARHMEHVQNTCDALNEAVAGTHLELNTLEQTIAATADDDAHAVVYDYASELWNHRFAFRCLTPNDAHRQPSELVREHLAIHFDGVDKFRKLFEWHALSLFGSGWLWLVCTDGQLELYPTLNADSPLLHKDRDVVPVFGCDLWEHAYAIDCASRRDYLARFWRVANWSFVHENLKQGLEKAQIEAS